MLIINHMQTCQIYSYYNCYGIGDYYGIGANFATYLLLAFYKNTLIPIYKLVFTIWHNINL